LINDGDIITARSKIMITTELPDTVRKALGPDAARDLALWLDERLHTSEIPISAFVARQKVNVLVLEQVSTQLLANTPTLIQITDDKWVWRVPIDLTFPSHGRVGQVGELDVDAQYGEVHYTSEQLTAIRDSARELAQRVLHPAS
jgi:hypothetical protein